MLNICNNNNTAVVIWYTILRSYLRWLISFFTLNNQDLDLIEKFKSLLGEKQVEITNQVYAVLKLTIVGSPGNRPYIHKIAQLFQDSGYPEVARACYTAQVFGIPWIPGE